MKQDLKFLKGRGRSISGCYESLAVTIEWLECSDIPVLKTTVNALYWNNRIFRYWVLEQNLIHRLISATLENLHNFVRHVAFILYW